MTKIERENKKKLLELKKEKRNQKKINFELKKNARLEKLKLKELSKQISIKLLRKKDEFDEYKYNIPKELIVDENYTDRYVIAAVSQNDERLFVYKKSLNKDCASLISDGGGSYVYPYYQLRKFIPGYDVVSKNMKYTESILASSKILSIIIFKKGKNKKEK